MRAILVFCVAVLLSCGVDAIALPRATWRRAPLTWAGHVLIVLFLYALFMLLSARPMFSALCVMALLALIVLASNPKFETLREPLVFSDLALSVQVLRYPRFYASFVDMRRVIAADVAGVAVLALVCWADPPVMPHPWLMSLVAMAFSLALGFWIAARLPFTLDATADQRRHGFFVTFVGYLLNVLRPVALRKFQAQVQAGPFVDESDLPVPAAPAATPNPSAPSVTVNTLPDVIVIQSESYFDARRVSPKIDPSAYAQFDRSCRESVAWGDLNVPAWGANTMRSEFSFLTGLASEKLGYARFYPYVFLRRPCASLPGWLKRRSYQTLTMHPHHADFFGRDRVFPLLHFDRFLDISHFGQAPHAGPYIADAAVTDAICAALEDDPSRVPRFIFAITMENHGPLHLETVQPCEAQSYHALGEDPQWNELTIYLRHVANADAALGKLLDRLQASSRPTVVCFYGDHVPPLARQFRALGVMPQDSAYFIWRNFGDRPAARQNVPVETLGPMVLTAMQKGKTAHPEMGSA